MSINQILRETSRLYTELDAPQSRICSCEVLHVAMKVAVCAFTFFTSAAYLAFLEITR
jgi:hypothetical protein